MMNNIIEQPPNYERFIKCSVAIEILFCLILLILVLKQSINFYKKNFVPYMFMYQIEKKYEQNTGVMIEHNNAQKIQQQMSPKEIAAKQNEQNDGYMRTSKDALKNRQPNRSQTPLQVGVKQPQANPKSQAIIKQAKGDEIPQTTISEQNHKSISYRVNLSIERAIIKLPVFSIMAINVVLITSYQFLVILSYVGLIVMVANELVSERWQNLGMILQIVIAGVVCAGFINAYVTPRVQPF